MLYVAFSSLLLHLQNSQIPCSPVELLRTILLLCLSYQAQVVRMHGWQAQAGLKAPVASFTFCLRETSQHLLQLSTACSPKLPPAKLTCKPHHFANMCLKCCLCAVRNPSLACLAAPCLLSFWQR